MRLPSGGARDRAVRAAGRRAARRRMGRIRPSQVAVRHSAGIDALHDLQCPGARGHGDFVSRRSGAV